MGAANLREPAVAGSFYPGAKRDIFNQINSFFGKEETYGGEKVMGAIAPHAGWIYSGSVAGAVFASIEVPEKVILLGPNHRGLGASAAIDSTSGWRFPFGTVPVDEDIAGSIVKNCPELKFDSSAHALEHSLEVIVPFLYVKNREVKIVPISLYAEDEELIEKLGKAVAKAAGEHEALIVASTDMTHYLPDTEARRIDGESIKIIEEMNPKKLLEKARRDRALCGGASVAVLLSACMELGAKEAKLVKYATSGDTAGSRESVVGYAGLTVA